ncbi:MAG TPA: hypothetical protein PKE55_09030 [Kiritimatiellia bacterium]|nr:hypothetical protein [Kiritimatiellia bacterium]
MTLRRVIWVVAAGWLGFGLPAVATGPFGGNDSGIPGTSTVFRGWISNVEGWVQPVAGSGGYSRNSNGDFGSGPEVVIGFPGGFDLDEQDMPFHVFSLGNGGRLTVSFEGGIANRPGPDFAVFENGFTDWTRPGDVEYTFAELAFVEVGTTTNAWARFPSTYLGTNQVGLFGSLDVTLVDGLAGKHRLEYGTPFDLSVLVDHPNVVNGSVDLNFIRYVRLIDVIGNGSTTDSSGRPIYDPFNHASPSTTALTDGFDLRGVGVIHFAGLELELAGGQPHLRWFAEAGRSYRMLRGVNGVLTWFGEEIAGEDGWVSHPDPEPVAAALYYLEVLP